PRRRASGCAPSWVGRSARGDPSDERPDRLGARPEDRRRQLPPRAHGARAGAAGAGLRRSPTRARLALANTARALPARGAPARHAGRARPLCRRQVLARLSGGALRHLVPRAARAPGLALLLLAARARPAERHLPPAPRGAALARGVRRPA